METTEIDAPITFDPATDTYRLHRDRRSDESVTAAVVEGVAAVTNTPPTELEPLYETIDPGALDRLFGSLAGGRDRDDGWLSFYFNDCAVIVYATGTIEITPAEDDEPITAPVPRTPRNP